MWELSPSEQHAVFLGTDKIRAWWYELALYTAWHTASFATSALVGKLRPWDHYRQKLTGKTIPAPVQSWQERKAARQAQMDLLKRHQQQRTVLPKVRRG